MPLLCFKLFKGARPVFFQQTGQRPIRQQPAAGLTPGAVIGFSGGVANALNRFAANRTGFSIATVDSHVFAKGGHFFRKTIANFLSQPLGPIPQGLSNGMVKSLDLICGQSIGEQDGRQAGMVKDFIGLGIANAAEYAGICERAFKGMIFGKK